jgi:hypothetical protein
VGISERSRRRSIEAARGLLPPNPIQSYATAVTGQYPPMVTGALLGGWAALFAASIALIGGVIVPGGLVVFAIKHALNNPRGVLVVDGGVALMRRSFVHGRPNAVEALLPTGSILPRSSRGSYVELQVGPEVVWMHKKEYDRLLAAGSGGFIGYGYAGTAT